MKTLLDLFSDGQGVEQALKFLDQFLYSGVSILLSATGLVVLIFRWLVLTRLVQRAKDRVGHFAERLMN